MITIKIASIPDRVMQLEQTIYQFLKQADKIEVYLNNYAVIPQFLIHGKIQVFTSAEYGDRGDIGKFFQIEHASGYVLTIDDDLIYPDDYVQKMTGKIDLCNRKSFICVHANRLPQNKLTSYYRDKLGIHFEKALDNDTQVEIPGTGTLGFHTDLIKLTSDIFIKPNMTDLWLAIYAKNKGIPIICMARAKNWLLQARGQEFMKSIYKSAINDDSYQTSLINESFYSSEHVVM
jgi:hypothetical protein